MDTLFTPVQHFFGPTWPAVWTLMKIIAIAIPLILAVAYLTLAGTQDNRLDAGAHRPQPGRTAWSSAAVCRRIQAAVQGDHRPSGANRYLFFIAPMLALGPALAAWAVVPFNDTMVLSNINAGLLYVLAMTSVGVYGIILAGWASNSKYAFLGCLRSAAQIRQL
jgi:NADH-quinone oxidoreductase subunit H